MPGGRVTQVQHKGACNGMVCTAASQRIAVAVAARWGTGKGVLVQRVPAVRSPHAGKGIQLAVHCLAIPYVPSRCKAFTVVRPSQVHVQPHLSYALRSAPAATTRGAGAAAGGPPCVAAEPLATAKVDLEVGSSLSYNGVVPSPSYPTVLSCRDGRVPYHVLDLAVQRLMHEHDAGPWSGLWAAGGAGEGPGARPALAGLGGDLLAYTEGTPEQVRWVVRLQVSLTPSENDLSPGTSSLSSHRVDPPTSGIVGSTLCLPVGLQGRAAAFRGRASLHVSAAGAAHGGGRGAALPGAVAGGAPSGPGALPGGAGGGGGGRARPGGAKLRGDAGGADARSKGRWRGKGMSRDKRDKHVLHGCRDSYYGMELLSAKSAAQTDSVLLSIKTGRRLTCA